MEDLHAAIASYLRHQRPEPRPVAAREVAIYARVATLAQGEPDMLDTQVAACRAYASSRGDTVGLIYREEAGGMSLDRPRLAELRAAIALGRVGTVFVTALDRLTRDRGLLLALDAEWAALGVAIVVAGEQWARGS